MRLLMIFILLPLLALPDQVLHVHAGTYNFFHLVLRWPPTFCQYVHHDVACKTPYKNIFTIHGMWPMKTNSQATPGNPQFRFKQDVITGNLARNLRTSWPELRQGHNDMNFWRSEWDKHGSGSSSADKEKEKWQTTYFTYANQHFTTLSLGNLGLEQKKNHTLQAIKDAINLKIQNKYVPAQIQCHRDPTSNIWTLYQIRFCISKSGSTIIDARTLPGCGSLLSNCPAKDILFPANP